MLMNTVHSPDITMWTSDDVKKWLYFAAIKYNLTDLNIDLFRNVDGVRLSQMTWQELYNLAGFNNIHVLYPYLNNIRKGRYLFNQSSINRSTYSHII